MIDMTVRESEQAAVIRELRTETEQLRMQVQDLERELHTLQGEVPGR